MLRALRTAALGMAAQQINVDNISNNLANVNTNGYKRTNVVFHDLLYQTIRTSGQGEDNTPAGSLQIGHGAAAVATVRNFTQGGIEQTGNALDMAILGDGFLQVQRADGTYAYTRDGSFTLNADGQIQTHTGLAVGEGILIPDDASQLTISQDGIVTAVINGDTGITELGTIELARFSNPAGLQPVGDNLFEETSASGTPTVGLPGSDGMGGLRQGFRETSNVDIVSEMVSLISAQRAYELNSKMVTTSEEMLQIANNIKR